MSQLIEFQQVSKIFGDYEAVSDLDLTIETGEIFVLVGSSGSGKTTTLKMINRLIEPSAGTIRFKNQAITEIDKQRLRWQMGYVLQDIALFPTMTVAENISVIPDMLGWSKEEQQKRVNELLNIVHLDPDIYSARFPDELSGGEQQRVGICHGIAGKPEILLMDEPFSALDPLVRTSLQNLMVDLHQQLKMTVIFVTHNMDEAVKLGDRIGVMSKGRLIQIGTPSQILENPNNRFVEDFFNVTEEASKLFTTAAELVEEGYGHFTDEKNEYPFVEKQTSVRELFEPLSSAPAVQLENGWLITSKDLFSFLNS